MIHYIDIAINIVSNKASKHLLSKQTQMIIFI